jgi:hypothetical protein
MLSAIVSKNYGGLSPPTSSPHLHARSRLSPGRTVHAERILAGLLERAFASEEIDGVKQSFGQTKDLAASPQAKLPEIVRLRKEGKSLCEIGRRLGFAHKAIGRALKSCKMG